MLKSTISADKTQIRKPVPQNNLTEVSLYSWHILACIGLDLGGISWISSLHIIIIHIQLLCPLLPACSTRPTLVISVLLTMKFWKPANTPHPFSGCFVFLIPVFICILKSPHFHFSSHFSVLSPHEVPWYKQFTLLARCLFWKMRFNSELS